MPAAPVCTAPNTPLPTDTLCCILSNVQVGPTLWIMRLLPQHHAATGQAASGFTCHPGQFVMVGLPETSGVPSFSFRRPMSVYQTHDDGSLSIFYKVHGRGTRLFSELTAGNTLALTGPLGNTLPQDAPPESTLLVGGGIGIAPLVCWASRHLSPSPTRLVYGVHSQADIGISDAIESIFTKEHTLICTDDGSTGFNGNVVAGLTKNPQLTQGITHVLICGPMPMMRATWQFCQTNLPDANVYVSLEEHMPCGTGSCSGCVVDVIDEPLPVKSCQVGPVFLASRLQWATTSVTAGSNA